MTNLRLHSYTLIYIPVFVLEPENIHTVIYRKIPNISPGLITFQRLYLGGLYSGGGGGLYSEGSLCQEQIQKDKITLIVIQCYLEKHKN